MHLLLRLPPEVSDGAIAADARSEGIALTPLSPFQLAPSETGGLVVGYGRLHEAGVEEATEALANVIRAYM